LHENFTKRRQVVRDVSGIGPGCSIKEMPVVISAVRVVQLVRLFLELGRIESRIERRLQPPALSVVSAKNLGHPGRPGPESNSSALLAFFERGDQRGHLGPDHQAQMVLLGWCPVRARLVTGGFAARVRAYARMPGQAPNAADAHPACRSHHHTIKP
jgi:hypothetical protein